MAPLYITALFECYIKPTMQKELNAKAVEGLFKESLIRCIGPLGTELEVTARGRAYLEYIMKVPLPVETWTVPNV